jgi:uncharacterized linocin/CFP29 family protein
LLPIVADSYLIDDLTGQGAEMTEIDPQVPWTHEQWARVNQVVQEEASRARVAASFLPLFGPLPSSTDFVRREALVYNASGAGEITLADTDTAKLPTLQIKVHVRGAQMSDPELASVLAMFRRAANLIARVEDALVFNGQPGPGMPPDGAPQDVGQVLGGDESRGLLASDEELHDDPDLPRNTVEADGGDLVRAVSKSIGDLENNGHFGPFAVVLGQDLFVAAQTPEANSMVLPQDRIVPLLGGGSLLRSTTLPSNKGVVVALGGAPVELVVATDLNVAFLQITTDPTFVLRAFEKVALRIKEPDAIVALVPPADAAGEAEAQAKPSRRRRGRP